jgi:hypothetical protein
MSLSRRGFFRGLFGAGAAAVLAPVVKLIGKPGVTLFKAQQIGVSTAPYQFGFTGWKYLDESSVVRPLSELSFEPKLYYVNVLLEKPGSAEAN